MSNENDKPTPYAPCCLFAGGELLLRRSEAGTLRIPCIEEVSQLTEAAAGDMHEVTMNSGRQLYAMAVEKPADMGTDWVWMGLRASYDHLPLGDYQAAGKAAQIIHWDKHSHYCPACGCRTVRQAAIMKKCPQCGFELFPPVSTAIIVLIERGDEILLVRARNFRGTFHGLVAGFLETGETLEECVVREVMEETGLMVKNIRYIASQPWPYPSGLMVGFMAEYAGGDIKLQEEELTSAAFYRRDNLPELPQKLSIARKLIDLWLQR